MRTSGRITTGIAAAALLAIVSYEAQHVDEIRRQSDLPITVVSSTLAIMELKGLVRQAGLDRLRG